MKKNISIFLLIIFSIATPLTFAKEVTKKYASDIEAPKWEDYVHEKYFNPRTDFKRKTAYFEMACGFVLTDLIITAPIGIPLIYHSATKIKNISYGERKAQFEQGLKVAETIKDEELKKAYYKTLIKDCKLSERKKRKLAKKRAKRAEKEKLEQEKKREKEKSKFNGNPL